MQEIKSFLAGVDISVDKKSLSDKLICEYEKEFRMLKMREYTLTNLSLCFAGVLSPDGILLDTNNISLDFIKREKKDVIGKYFWECPWWSYSEESQGKLKCLVGEAAKGERIRLEINNTMRSGSQHVIDFSLTPIHDEKNDIIAIIAEGYDITEHKKAEERYLRIQKHASMSTLAGGIAHDFNNILMGIMGYTSLILTDKTVSEKTKQRAESILNSCEQARSLTDQLLSFTRVRDMEFSIVKIGTAIRKSVEFAIGTNSPCKAEMKIEKNLWPIKGDIVKISQVINGILLNAKEAMPKGGPINVLANNEEVAEKNPHGLKAGSYVRISISDTGDGIPEENIKRIFDPYFTTKKRGVGGDGLGLAISASIIQKHSGFIAIESEIGKGSTFSIFLPAAKKEIIDPIQNPVGDNISSLNILVMDDDKLVRNVLGSILERFGHEAVMVENGNEAIEKYRQKTFDLVILDLMIPGGMGGEETRDKIKEIDPEAKIIVSSGYGDKVPEGFLATLPKPYSLNKIREVIENIF